MPDDTELLREYVERGSEEAFRSLVERHAGMVHNTALRVVHNESMAEEITQAVFIILARKAPALRRNTVLPGWLYRTAHFVALEALRTENRRQRRDRDFFAMKDLLEPTAVWQQVAPVLDEAMHRLRSAERDALVLRFLEQRSFAEVAAALSTTEAAAKMRVGRAVEKLRASLAQCGVTVPTAALLAALSIPGATAAPAGLTAAVTASVLAQPGAAGSSMAGLVKGALILMAWNKGKFAVATVLIMLLAAASGVRIWKWQSRRPPVGPALLKTFEPMSGEWEGIVTLTRDGRVISDKRTCSMGVTTQQGGRICEIELRLQLAPDSEPVLQHYAHKLNEKGDRLFTISDPASGRGDGECEVIHSFHNPAGGEWRAAMRFPLPGQRGVMEGSWGRRGDSLVVRSHDESLTSAGLPMCMPSWTCAAGVELPPYRDGRGA